MSNYHVYISIISKLRYTSTASCWFAIWKLNKLVVKTEFNSAFTKGAVEVSICSRWLHNPSRQNSAPEPALGPPWGQLIHPGTGSAREGYPDAPQHPWCPVGGTSHLQPPPPAQPSPLQWAATAHESSGLRSVKVPGARAAQPEIPNQTQPQSSLWDPKHQLRSKMWVPEIRDRAFYD